MADLPLLIAAIALWLYWAGVLVQSVRSRLLYGHSTGLVPRDRRERLMWLLWTPTIIAWNTLPAVATKDHWLVELPTWAEHNMAALVLRWAAAVISALCYLTTVVCWFAMGRSWSIATPDEQHQLVTTGPFAIVRHPIYALSILLMICTVTALPTLPMLVVGVIHITMIVLKVRGEEQHLLRQYGDEYRRYMSRVQCFIPTRRLLNPQQ